MRLNEERIDYELIQSLLVHIDDHFEEGAVLVFLPGMAEINNLYDQLISSYHFGKDTTKRDWVLPLHSNISPEEQRGVFKNPPKGIRKIVLATNIAETSITIDDIVYVVDAGHVKERQYDASRGLGMLIEGWISSASAKQRKGRAGRVRPGRRDGSRGGGVGDIAGEDHGGAGQALARVPEIGRGESTLGVPRDADHRLHE